MVADPALSDAWSPGHEDEGRLLVGPRLEIDEFLARVAGDVGAGLHVDDRIGLNKSEGPGLLQLLGGEHALRHGAVEEKGVVMRPMGVRAIFSTREEPDAWADDGAQALHEVLPMLLVEGAIIVKIVVGERDEPAVIGMLGFQHATIGPNSLVSLPALQAMAAGNVDVLKEECVLSVSIHVTVILGEGLLRDLDREVVGDPIQVDELPGDNQEVTAFGSLGPGVKCSKWRGAHEHKIMRIILACQLWKITLF